MSKDSTWIKQQKIFIAQQKLHIASLLNELKYHSEAIVIINRTIKHDQKMIETTLYGLKK